MQTILRSVHRRPVTPVIAIVAAACVGASDDVAPITSQITEGVPEAHGFSPEGLATIGPAMQELIDAGRTAGVMTLVARGGAVVHWEARGWRVLDEQPLERDDVFRIYSMTKPVTSVAVMMLVEEGKLRLDQPLTDFLPAFADVQVYDEGDFRPCLLYTSDAADE